MQRPVCCTKAQFTSLRIVLAQRQDRKKASNKKLFSQKLCNEARSGDMLHRPQRRHVRVVRFQGMKERRRSHLDSLVPPVVTRSKDQLRETNIRTNVLFAQRRRRRSQAQAWRQRRNIRFSESNCLRASWLRPPRCRGLRGGWGTSVPHTTQCHPYHKSLW